MSMKTKGQGGKKPGDRVIDSDRNGGVMTRKGYWYGCKPWSKTLLSPSLRYVQVRRKRPGVQESKLSCQGERTSKTGDGWGQRRRQRRRRWLCHNEPLISHSFNSVKFLQLKGVKLVNFQWRDEEFTIDLPKRILKETSTVEGERPKPDVIQIRPPIVSSMFYHLSNDLTIMKFNTRWRGQKDDDRWKVSGTYLWVCELVPKNWCKSSSLISHTKEV